MKLGKNQRTWVALLIKDKAIIKSTASINHKRGIFYDNKGQIHKTYHSYEIKQNNVETVCNSNVSNV